MPSLRSSDAYARRSGQGRTERRYGDSAVSGSIALINGVRIASYAFLPKAHARPDLAAQPAHASDLRHAEVPRLRSGARRVGQGLRLRHPARPEGHRAGRTTTVAFIGKKGSKVV